MRLVLPVVGATKTSGFGSRWGTFHQGVDFAAPVGTPLYAAADGVVVEGKDRAQGTVHGFGSWIWLDCQESVGLDFIYGHVKHSAILVKVGDRVKAGQQIGVVGNEGISTGAHLHFECWTAPGRLGGTAVNPDNYLANAKQPGQKTQKEDSMATTYTVVDWSQKFGFGEPRSTKQIRTIVLHTTENTVGTPAENVANYQINSQSGSYHYLVDTKKLLRENTDGWLTWSAGRTSNLNGLHLSFVAQARLTRSQWLLQNTMLDMGAWQVARWVELYGIPVRFIKGEQLARGSWGITTHYETTRAWHETDHTDPGQGFPMDIFLQKVSKCLEKNKTTTTPRKDTAVAHNPVMTDEELYTQLMGSGGEGWDPQWLADQFKRRGNKGTLLDMVGTIVTRLDSMQHQLDELKR